MFAIPTKLSPEDVKTLQDTLMGPQVLVPGTEEYSKAVFIGNLNYRMTMPATVIQAQSVHDVRSIIDFARTNDIRLTVKNGGHSYMGYCLNQDGIVLDVSPMKGCYINHDDMTIQMEAGLVWKDVYYKYLKNPRTIIIGGQCPSVGVSGFTLGGGLSPFSRSYGLGCDNVIEMTIVTWEGKVVTVRRDDEDEGKRDLFWALAGGGGGNFGVTVDMTCQMYQLEDKDGKVVCGQLAWHLPQQAEAFENMMNTFNTTKWPKELTIDALWSHGPNKQLTGGMTVIYNGNKKRAQEVLAPLLAFAPETNGLRQMCWKDWVRESEKWDVRSEVYHHHASFIFAEGAITRDLTKKISSLMEEATQIVKITDGNEKDKHHPKPKCHFLWDHIGGKTEEVAPDASPFYWRKGHYVSTLKMQWTCPNERTKIMEFIAKCQSELLPYAIEQKAAYLNYIDNTIPHWQEAYYGRNYPRLQRIKTKWDPNNFFHHAQSIQPIPDGEEPLPVHGKLAVPTPDEILELPQVKKVEKWWNQYSTLVTPEDLGSPQTEEDVYRRDAEIRRNILAMREA